MAAPSRSRERVLSAVVSADVPVSLEEVARAVGLSPSPTHGHLNALVQAGALERRERGGEVRYLPAPRLAVDWIWTDAHHPGEARRWFRHAWQHQGLVDWRFPLVTRLPDAEAQAVVNRFLEVAWMRGLFQPWLAAGDAPPRRTDWGGHTVIVHGSSARGDARSRSDVDVVVVLPMRDQHFPYDQREAFLALADDVNLGAARYLDLIVMHRDGVGGPDMPMDLWKSIRQDGIAVFSTFPDGEYGFEAPSESDA